MITIYKAAAPDYDALLQTFKQFKRNTAECDNYFKWKNNNQCEIILASNQAKQIVGHAIILWHSRFKAHLLSKVPECMDLYVTPPFQQKGIGTNLLNHCEQVVLDAGLKKLGLGVVNKIENSHIHLLYLKLGYQLIDNENLDENEILVYEKEFNYEKRN